MGSVDRTWIRRSPSRRVRQLREWRDSVLGSLAQLDDSTLAEIVRRTEQSAGLDGFASGGERVGGRANIAADAPVTVHALAGLPEDDRQDNWARHRVFDPVGDAVGEMAQLLAQMDATARRVVRLADVVAHARDAPRGRQTSLQGNCIACGEAVSGTLQDRLRRGLDSRCWVSWTAWKLRHELDSGDPGAQFLEFVAWRQARIAEQATMAADLEAHPLHEHEEWRIAEIERLRKSGEHAR